jgi:hypothetical protein
MTIRVLGTWPAALCALSLAGCTDDGTSSFGDDLTDPQLPARGAVDLPQWLAAGSYRAWRCEPQPHPGRPPSPHGATRICNNDALHAAAAGAGGFPVGAAAVKEIFAGDRVVSYAVSRKLTAGDGGDRWYWYEGNAEKVYGNGPGVTGCTGCHGRAARDFVFTVVP